MQPPDRPHPNGLRITLVFDDDVPAAADALLAALHPRRLGRAPDDQSGVSEGAVRPPTDV
jgi:hypothetical protein